MRNYLCLFRFIKYKVDFIVAVLVCFLLFPLGLFIILILFLTLRGNPLFTQLRPGQNGELFRIFKFRTMTNKTDKHGNLLPDNIRITFIGRLIRSLSLDELPQLINIIKGDMSFIGPRPLLPEYLALYDEFQNRRHDVKPGITGWAQVNGRNSIKWEEKFELDVMYVDNQSFCLDIKIIWLTIIKVLKRDGVSSETSMTMEKFEGSKL